MGRIKVKQSNFKVTVFQFDDVGDLTAPEPTQIARNYSLINVDGTVWEFAFQNPASLVPEKYLVLLKSSAFNSADLPVDKTTYAVDDVIGGATVIGVGTSLTYLIEDLDPAQSYRAAIISFNDDGVAGRENYKIDSYLAVRQPTWSDAPTMKGSRYRQVAEVPISHFASDVTTLEHLDQNNSGLDVADILANCQSDLGDVAICDTDLSTVVNRHAETTRSGGLTIAHTVSRSASVLNKVAVYYGNPNANISNNAGLVAAFKSMLLARGSCPDLTAKETYRDQQTVGHYQVHCMEIYNGVLYYCYLNRFAKIYAGAINATTGAVVTAPTQVISGASYFVSNEQGHCVPDLTIIKSGAQQGKIVITWTDAKTSAGKVFSIRSTNAESVAAWPGTPVTVYTAGSGNEPNRPNLAQLSDGTLCLVWNEQVASAGYYRLYFYKSTDGAASWSGGIIMTESSGDYVYGRMEIGAGDVIHLGVEWQDTQSPFLCDAFYMKSTDAGATWVKRDGTSISIPANHTALDPVYAPGGGLVTRVHDLMEDASGNPVFCNIESNTTSTSNIKAIRWSGSAWAVESVGASALLKAPRQSRGACFGLTRDTIYIVDDTTIKKYTYSGGSWSLASTTMAITYGEMFWPFRIRGGTALYELACVHSHDYTAATAGWGMGHLFVLPDVNSVLGFGQWQGNSDALAGENNLYYQHSTDFNFSNGTFTVSGRFKRGTVSTEEDIFCRRENGVNAGWIVQISSSGFLRMVYVTSAGNILDLRNTTRVDDNAWHTFHCVFGTNVATSQMWIDGTQITGGSLTNSSTGTPAGATDSSEEIRIGRRDPNTVGNMFKGLFDLMAVRSGAVASALIVAEHNNFSASPYSTVPAGVESRQYEDGVNP